VSQAICCDRTQPGNNVGVDGTHDISVDNNLANGMCDAGYQEIYPVLKIIIEI